MRDIKTTVDLLLKWQGNWNKKDQKEKVKVNQKKSWSYLKKGLVHGHSIGSDDKIRGIKQYWRRFNVIG